MTIAHYSCTMCKLDQVDVEVQPINPDRKTETPYLDYLSKRSTR